MILDFKYTIDSSSGKVITESGGLKKYLLPLLKTHKVAEIISVFSMVLFENFYKEKLLTKKNRYNINESSEEYLKYNIWELGHDLTEGSKYTGSKEYLQRQARSLSTRILKKNTRPSYVYLFYVYGFKYNYSYKGNIINNSNKITNILEGVDNITIGATVYGEGVKENTFVIKKGVDNNGIGFIDLSQNVVFRKDKNIIGYGLTFSFYNEDIDALVSSQFPIKSIEQIKGLSIADLVDFKNYSLDYDQPITLSILDNPNLSLYSRYSSEDSPKIKEENGNKYIKYDYLALDSNEPIALVDAKGKVINISQPDLKSWYLDNENLAQISTRHFILNYIMNSVETDTDFLTQESNDAFYNDTIQLKRKIEVPHFEPKLNITFPVGTLPPNPFNIVKYPNLYDFTYSINNITYLREMGKLNDVAVMTTICFTDKLSEITHIQFGTSKRTDLNNILINDMDVLLNDNINNTSVNTHFQNQDLFLDSIQVSPKNKYRFINPLNYDGYVELFRGISIPQLDLAQQELVNKGEIDNNLPYYELNINNRWSFPIEYFKIDRVNSTQLILRNYLFPYFKWSAFSEISFLKKTSIGNVDSYETLMYASFPKINYSEKMLSSIYLNIYLQYNFEEIDKKVSFTFKDTDWEDSNSYKYLQIPYANLEYGNYVNYTFEYVKTTENSITNSYYFFQNIGYNPSVYIFKTLQGDEYELIKVDAIQIESNGNITIKINNTNILEPFSGKIILI